MRIRSVQLPAHPIARHQTFTINSSEVDLPAPLEQEIIQTLQDLQLETSLNKTTDYVLTLHQLDTQTLAPITYQLVQSDTMQSKLNDVIKQFPNISCDNTKVSVSMRLTHRDSGDVVWFAKASMDVASFQNKSLIFEATLQEKVDNEHQVMSFVVEHNTKQARQFRAEHGQNIQIPDFEIKHELIDFKKISGACNATEILPVTLMLKRYLVLNLIDKINVE